jgi:hypothetical protein
MLVVALATASLALPAAALGYTDPPQDPGARLNPVVHKAAQAPSPTTAQVSTAKPAAGSSNEGGFDWGDAAIGAGAALALIAVAGGLVAYRREAPSVSAPAQGS